MSQATEVLDLVALQLGLRKVALQDRFIEDLGAESVDIVNIIATAEERFSIFIDEETASRLQTIGDLVQFIDRRA